MRSKLMLNPALRTSMLYAVHAGVILHALPTSFVLVARGRSNRRNRHAFFADVDGASSYVDTRSHGAPQGLREPRSWVLGGAWQSVYSPCSSGSRAAKTKLARISYADVLRTMKAIKAAGIADARVVIRLHSAEIEVIIVLASSLMRSRSATGSVPCANMRKRRSASSRAVSDVHTPCAPMVNRLTLAALPRVDGAGEYRPACLSA